MKIDPFSRSVLERVAQSDEGRALIGCERQKMQALRDQSAEQFNVQLGRMDEALRNMDDALREILV